MRPAMFLRLLRRLDYWLHRGRREAELVEEMALHREQLAARTTSGARLGNTTLAREDARGVWMFESLERVWRDALYALRALRKEPTFALTALVTLALGSVAMITTFTIVDAELWKPVLF